MRVKHTVLPNGQPPSVASTVLAQLCGPKANETEMGSALFTKNDGGRSWILTLYYMRVHRPKLGHAS